MALHKNEDQIPTIFNEIIRKRVADYIEDELRPQIRQKVESIITDVLSGLQLDSGLFKDMYRHETQLVVKAIYKGQEIKQKNTVPGGK